MMQLRHGIFDDASISVIASDTVREIGRLTGQTRTSDAFARISWFVCSGRLHLKRMSGLAACSRSARRTDSAAIAVTMRDVRCSMVNLDPDSASAAPEVLRAVVHANESTAGVYGTVTRIGPLAVGQTVILHAAAKNRKPG